MSNSDGKYVRSNIEIPKFLEKNIIIFTRTLDDASEAGGDNTPPKVLGIRL